MIQIKRVSGDVEWFGPGYHFTYARRCHIGLPGMPWICRIHIRRPGRLPVELSWRWCRL